MNYSKPDQRQEWCQNCGARLPLGGYGQCGACTQKVSAKRREAPSMELCPECGHQFFNAWEQMQHTMLKRHEYRAWTPEDEARAIAKMENRGAA